MKATIAAAGFRSRHLVALLEQCFQITLGKTSTSFAELEQLRSVSRRLLGIFHIYAGRTDGLIKLPESHVCYGAELADSLNWTSTSLNMAIMKLIQIMDSYINRAELRNTMLPVPPCLRITELLRSYSNHTEVFVLFGPEHSDRASTQFA